MCLENIDVKRNSLLLLGLFCLSIFVLFNLNNNMLRSSPLFNVNSSSLHAVTCFRDIEVIEVYSEQATDYN